MAFDCMAIGVGLFASVMATWPANEKFTYGYDLSTWLWNVLTEGIGMLGLKHSLGLPMVFSSSLYPSLSYLKRFNDCKLLLTPYSTTNSQCAGCTHLK